MTDEQRMLEDGITIDGREFAAAWMNVSVAAADDEARPVLHRTVSLELYNPGGLRLTSTDSVLLLTATVDGNPARDEAPVESIIVSDGDQRGRGLLSYIYKLGVAAEKAGTIEPSITLRVCQPQSTDRPTLSPELARRVLRISTESESVDLDLIEGDYPAWRGLFPTGEPAAIQRVRFAPPLLARLGKFKDVEGGIRFEFTSDTGPALITTAGGTYDASLEGLIMPMQDFS